MTAVKYSLSLPQATFQAFHHTGFRRWIIILLSSVPFFFSGHDFCAEGVVCGENSECKNRNTKAECECRSGYASIHGDSTYCEGRTYPFYSRAFLFKLQADVSLMSWFELLMWDNEEWLWLEQNVFSWGSGGRRSSAVCFLIIVLWQWMCLDKRSLHCYRRIVTCLAIRTRDVSLFKDFFF